MDKRLIIIFFSIFLIIVAFFYVKGTTQLKEYSFNGTIDLITYDRKMILTVYVNFKDYYLSYMKNFKNNVEVGDYIEKNKGELKIKIIKKLNGKVFVFNL